MSLDACHQALLQRKPTCAPLFAPLPRAPTLQLHLTSAGWPAMAFTQMHRGNTLWVDQTELCRLWTLSPLLLLWREVWPLFPWVEMLDVQHRIRSLIFTPHPNLAFCGMFQIRGELGIQLNTFMLCNIPPPLKGLAGLGTHSCSLHKSIQSRLQTMRRTETQDPILHSSLPGWKPLFKFLRWAGNVFSWAEGSFVRPNWWSSFFRSLIKSSFPVPSVA